MRRIVLAVLVAVTLVGVSVALAPGDDRDPPASTVAAGRAHGPKDTASGDGRPARTTTTTTRPMPESEGILELEQTVGGEITPKSVVASGHGRVFAQNMMYRHTVTVYDENGALVKTIPDSVDLAAFGIPDHPGTVQGAPVEMAFSPDGTKAYVSNYSMYGAGFGPEGDDDCVPSDGYDDSYVYRIDVETLAIDAVIKVGAVPKYVAATPDGRYLIVTNWCTYDASIVDTKTGAEVRRVPLGPYPRGIVVSPDSQTAYVAVMGSTDIARINLATFDVSWIWGVGGGPRHLVLSPDGASLYATLNRDGTVAKIDTASGAVQHKVSTGQAPRSMDISADGKRLYVVNYESGTMSVLDAGSMAKIQDLPTGYHPIGITYDRGTGKVWVANYAGSLMIFRTVAP
jgi:YVTN family beta-propeller protein